MDIRKATIADLDKIMPIYESARFFMKENHNPKQWGDGYPQKEVILKDIQNNNFFVCEESGIICASFAFIFGDDPTYAIIDNGAWLNEEPYATIHRLASIGKVKGVAESCFRWCWEHCKNLRIDTHGDNHIMHHVIKKAGFQFCGTIYVQDGSPRLAYQKI